MSYERTAWGATALLIAWFAAAMIVGCSHGDLGAEVSGNVTMDGKSIGPGIVNFSPAVGDSNPGIGNIQQNGSYSVKTSRTEGLVPGKYRVAVTVYANQGDTREQLPGPPKLLTPAKYNDVATSGLEYDVAPGRNTIDIELRSAE
jgi:hypothetical protein